MTLQKFTFLCLLAILSAASSTRAQCYGTNLGSPTIIPAPPAYCGGDPTPPAGGSDPGTCKALSANKTYRLTQDYSAAGGDANTCFTLFAGTKLNLNGHTVKGTIVNTSDSNGIVVTNGIVVCSPGAGVGCIEIDGGGTIRIAAVVQYINCTVNPASVMDNVRCINSDQPPTVKTPDGFALHYLYNTVTASVSGASREYAMNAQGNNNSLDAEWNVVLCPSTSFGCQGIVSQSQPPKIHLNNNFVVMPTNSTAQSGRAILADCSGCNPVKTGAGIDHQYANNVIYANNNRAFRIRTVGDVKVFGNTIYNCNVTGDLACIHLYDDANDYQPNLGACEIYKNTFVNVQGGVIIAGRGGTGCVSHDNIVQSSTGGTWGNVFTFPSGNAANTEIDFARDPVLGNPNILVNGISATITTSSIVCNSGVAASNSFGRVTNLAYSSCPPVVPHQ